MPRRQLTKRNVLKLHMELLAKACERQERLDDHNNQPHSAIKLRAAAYLLMLGMGPGSKVEVFHDTCFWEATIYERTCDGFYFTYDGSNDELGHAYLDDFLETWRLSNDGTQIYLTLANVDKMIDPFH